VQQLGQILDIEDGRNPVAETLVSEAYVPNSLRLSNVLEKEEDHPQV